jgi:hypothetical protein
MDNERRRVLDQLRRLVAADGRVVISVPIEIGPSLAGKQFFRLLAGLRRLGDYAHREKYSPLEMIKAVAGGTVERAVYDATGPDGPYRYCGHKGFDYRVLEREIEARFTVERRMFTPLPALGPLLNSQAWFVCRP